ncbi:hypothetical protein H5410_016221 [Solanum commersonii]|uniref:Uncharacterized protein n=1 Tax=Solanum commersonii TaxID=4109 RepID=A0A9J5ZVM8_SOLCO|nr:hypothetical protein H5410_016221 [Solanum commersonii]
MNAHNKTQLTHAMTNYALKDSNCDSSLSKMLKLTIRASNASSSSTKVLKCPHTKTIPYSHKVLQQFIVSKSPTTLTLTKMNTCMTSPIDHKGLFKACNRVDCKGWVPSFPRPLLKGEFFTFLDLPSLFTTFPT